MRQFGYLRDPLFLAAAAAYGLNRWILKPWLNSHFLRAHFNDLLLIPAALPVILWVQRQARLRLRDAPPSWAEIGLHLAIWTVVCEGVGPLWLNQGTADPLDVVAYAVGAAAAGLWWNRQAIAARDQR